MKELKKLEEEINAFADYFVKKYFKVKPSDIYWVADMVGGVLIANDYFFDLDFMMEAVRNKATPKQLFDFYDLELKFGMEDKPMEINFKNFIIYGKIK